MGLIPTITTITHQTAFTVLEDIMWGKCVYIVGTAVLYFVQSAPNLTYDESPTKRTCAFYYDKSAMTIIQVI